MFPALSAEIRDRRETSSRLIFVKVQSNHDLNAYNERFYLSRRRRRPLWKMLRGPWVGCRCQLLDSVMESRRENERIKRKKQIGPGLTEKPRRFSCTLMLKYSADCPSRKHVFTIFSVSAGVESGHGRHTRRGRK